MKMDESFTRAVEMLPDPVRERLDGDTPLDWPGLESPRFGAELGEAVAAHRRLPGAVEALAHRLIRDVGIVPTDVAAGIERQGAASAWINWVTLEADGDGYQIRNDRDGEVRSGVRPESLAGYTTLALELAAIVHEAGGRWVEAGARHRATPDEARSPLARCAVHMADLLQLQPEAISRHPSAAGLARTLEFAWNDLDRETRSKLAGVRLSTGRGARAPRRSYLTPARSHLLNAFDPGEIRWLRALAERAVAVDDRTTGVAPRAVERSGGEPAAMDADRIRFGSDPAGLDPDREVDELAHAAVHLRGSTRRWIEETYGAAAAEGLARLQSRDALGALSAALGPSSSRQPVPKWMLDLAEPLFRDSGVQTHAGLRTGSVRLDPQRNGRGEHRVEEVGTTRYGLFASVVLAEQVRLGLAFVNAAGSALADLEGAGKEGEWALGEADTGERALSANERETLEAAREVGHAIVDGYRRGSGSSPGASQSMLERIAIAAKALRAVGPTVRTAAGWPGGADPPDPRDPEDVARMAAVARALHGQVRAIANRIISRWISGAPASGGGAGAGAESGLPSLRGIADG